MCYRVKSPEPYGQPLGSAAERTSSQDCRILSSSLAFLLGSKFSGVSDAESSGPLLL